MLCIGAAHGLSCPKGTYITDYDIQGYAFPLITTSFKRIAKVCMLYSYVCPHLSEVCVHACCVLELLMACHVPREYLSLTRICVSLHNHGFMRIAKVCMHAIPIYLSEVCACCVFSCHVQREHITDYACFQGYAFPLITMSFV